MATEDRRPTNPNNIVYGFLALAVLLIVGGLWVIRQLSSMLSGGQWIIGRGANPLVMIKDLLTGQMHWSFWHFAVGVVLCSLVGIAGFYLLLWADNRARARRSIQAKASKLGNGQSLSRTAAQTKATEGNLVGEGAAPGLLFGQTMARKPVQLYTAWREGLVVIMGPGGRKTTGLATPLTLSAPGVVFGTSNKRDLVDQTRLDRETKGTLWCFDIQGIAGYKPAWWWNILSYVTDETRALTLSALFASTTKGARQPGGKDGDFFDQAGKELLARLLLAAAVSDRHVDQVFLWLADMTDQEPARILRRSGHIMSAAALEQTYVDPQDQRGGVFATARGFVGFLENRQALSWIAPLGPDDDRPQFNPEAFVRSKADTLLALSKEGDGSLGPVTTALTKALMDAAEGYANECGGRVPVPILVMLDEAANCARIGDLPQKYSFYGSMGLHVVTILQSPNQAVHVWGETGWKALWDAATIRIIGNGVKDDSFLKALAGQAGQHVVTRWNSSSGTKSYSSSSTHSKEDILHPSDLANLAPGQIYVVHNTGTPPVLGETIPYWKREEMAAVVTESKQTYGPKAKVADPETTEVPA